MDLADAILWIGYPGGAGDDAVAEVLFGEVSSSGKLPITFYHSTEQLPTYEDYSMAGRTYRYLESEPEFPFGFGLTYTKFEIDESSLDVKVLGKDDVCLSCRVSNVGTVGSEEVVQLYVRPSNIGYRVPNISLRVFERVGLNPGEQRRLRFNLKRSDLEFVDSTGKRGLLPGTYELIVGLSSPRGTFRGFGNEVSKCNYLNSVNLSTSFKLRS